MREDWEREEVIQVVDGLVDELLASACVDRPPVDTVALAQRHLGVQICIDSRQPQRGRAQRTAGKRQIFLRPEPSEERHQWTVAHEIGEHVKPSLLQRLGVEPGQLRAMAGESLANLLAYHLLVPTCWFVADAPGNGYDLLALKKLYRTASHEVIAWRFLDLPAPCIVTIVDNEAIHRRRSNAWRVRRRLEPPELRCQRYVHDYSRPRIVQEDGWAVQGWPVHQTDWKREILRSVVDPAEAQGWQSGDGNS
jgi:Zn-dependent peptidase ImmA (M78 family)